MGNQDKCHVPIPIPTIQRFLPLQQFNRLLEAAFSEHIEHRPQEFKYCTTPDCSQVYHSSPAGSAPLEVHCPSCLGSICATCNEEGHTGLTCMESKLRNNPLEQERANDRLARELGYKKCPSCSVWIEKTEGCNHMSCRCGAHICWVCMGTFDADTIYPHMNTAHGGMHADVPPQAVEPRELQEQYRVQEEVLRQAALNRERLARQDDHMRALRVATAREQERLRLIRENTVRQQRQEDADRTRRFVEAERLARSTREQWHGRNIEQVTEARLREVMAQNNDRWCVIA